MFDWYTWLLIPLLIFFARIMDVSIGTVRFILIARGFKLLAPLLGFFEVIIWLLAIRQILSNISSWVSYIAYGAGFAAGTYIGMYLEERLSLGKVIVRIMTRRNSHELVEALRDMRYGITTVDARGRDGQVQILFTVVNRSSIPTVVNFVKTYNPHAFYTIEDIRSAGDIDHLYVRPRVRRRFNFWRKGK